MKSGARGAPAQRSPRALGAGAQELGDVLSFLQLLWAITHGVEAISKRMQQTLGVTGPQRLVLRLVGRYGETTPSVLADVLHVHPSSLTGVLRRLEGAGLLRRVRDPADGRRAILSLTPSGQALNDQDRGTVEYAVRRTLRAVAAADARQARRVLATLARELGVESGAELTRSASPRPSAAVRRRART